MEARLGSQGVPETVTSGRSLPQSASASEAAAVELYRKPGYDKVTVAELAARAGLTPRTFFRYFSDKREVLFFGAEKVEALVEDGALAEDPRQRKMGHHVREAMRSLEAVVLKSPVLEQVRVEASRKTTSAKRHR